MHQQTDVFICPYSLYFNQHEKNEETNQWEGSFPLYHITICELTKSPWPLKLLLTIIALRRKIIDN